MSQPLAFPTSRYAPPAPVDLSDAAERARLSPPAIRAFFALMDRWSIRDEDARQLLGGISNGGFYALKKNPDRSLEEDKLRRISFLLGIFEALRDLYSDALADRWMTLPNKNALFAGRTPLAYLLEGGLPAFDMLRRLLDARRSGP